MEAVHIKEMSKEEFKEQEHPRSSDGKFTNKKGGKVSKQKRSIAKKAALAVAGISAGTLAVLALRRSSALRSELDDVIKNVDNIIKESKPVKEGLSKVEIEQQLKNVPYSAEPIKKTEQKVSEEVIKKVKAKTPSFESHKLIREADEALDDATKKIFGVNFESKKLEGLDRVFSGRIKQGYWTDENFIDPLFSLNKLRKTKDLTSIDLNNVIKFYGGTIKELNKELRLVNKLNPASRSKVKKLKLRAELARYAELSAKYKKAVYLGKIDEGSDAIKAYRAESDRFFDVYTAATRELDVIDKALAAKPSSKSLTGLNKEKQRLEQIKDRSEKIYKILNSDADTVLINTEDLAGFKKSISNENLENLATRYAKDYGVSLPREMKVEDIGLSYESKRVLGGKKISQKEQYRKMLKERIKRKYKEKSEKEIEDIVEELSKKEMRVRLNTKSMTAEQFDEYEHPRDESGKFASKPGASPKVQKPKGSHGGFRKFSGRLPKNTAEAVETQKQKYRQKYPEMTDQEITNKLIDYGNKNNKGADWHLYVTSREKYDKIQKQRIEDAQKSKINRAYVNGKEVDWRPPINVKDSIKEQSNKFRRDIAKYKSLKEATKKFNDKDLPTVERNAARLILAVGSVATALGIAAIVATRPRLEPLKKVVPNLFADVLGTEGKVPKWYAEQIAKNIVPQDARLFQLNKVMGEGKIQNPFREVQSANSFNKALGMFIARSSSKLGSKEATNLLRSGKPISISFGPGKAGYKGRFKLNDEYIEIYGKNTKMKYEPRVGDRGYYGNNVWATMTSKDGGIKTEELKNIWLAKQIQLNKGRNPIAKIKGVYKFKKGALPPGLSISEDGLLVVKNKRDFIGHAESKGWINFVDNKQRTDFYLRQDGELFPASILRKWSTFTDAQKARAEINDFGGWADFISNQSAGISRKILALLSLTPGTGAAMYYFSMDIKDAAKTLKKEREKQLQMAKKLSEPNIKKESSKKQEQKPRKSKEKTEVETKKKNEPKEIENVKPELEDVVNQDVLSDKELDEMNYTQEQKDEYRKVFGKGFSPEIEESATNIDVTDAVALQIADDISNISQACKLAIDSGMPGSDQFEQINNKLVEMYAVLKDKAIEAKEMS